MNLKHLLRLLKQSIKTEHHDFTQGPITDAVILLAVPMILELGLESVFAVVDMFFVSKLGANAIATVGLTESVLTIVYSMAIGLSTGAAAIVARRIGEKKTEEAAHSAAQSFVLALFLSVPLSLVGWFCAEDILHWMGAAQSVINEGVVFTRILVGGSPVIMYLFLINGVFRGAGNAAMAMKSLWLASGVNILLCPLLISIFGLKGAAIATLLGRTSGVIYQLSHLAQGKGELQIRLSQFTIHVETIKNLIKIAWPASFQFIIGSGSWIVLTKLVAETGGTAASAGYQIAFRNFVFFILPAWGLSNAAATLVGQNLGAKNIQRAQESVFTTAKFSAGLMALITVLIVTLADPIVSVFTSDQDVFVHAVDALRIIGSGYIFYGVAMVMSQALNGAGDTKTPTWINLFCFWVFQTPLAYYLTNNLGWKAKGAILAIPISQALLAGVTTYVFRRGKWKNIQL